MKQLRKRLTFANVMSVIAVFIALGATAFAATQLPKNSVGSKQLKKNAVTAAKIKKEAVTGAKIKKDTVTGAKVNEASLGTVPSANLANSLPPLEAVHIVGAPGEPGFENGAKNIPTSGLVALNPVGFYKDHDGIVHLQGVAEVGKSSGGVPTVFTLPPGFRPAPGKASIFEIFNEALALVFGSNTNVSGIELSGKVLGNEEKAIVLDGITYRAES
jgi:hypothetical protein